MFKFLRNLFKKKVKHGCSRSCHICRDNEDYERFRKVLMEAEQSQ